MDKVVYYNSLFLLYKNLLTNNEQDIFSLYYEENYSMGEISEMKGISRSAVGKYITNVESKLQKYEDSLRCYEKNNKLIKLLDFNDIAVIKNGIQELLYIS